MIRNSEKLHSALFSWWRKHGRILPWRAKNVEARKELNSSVLLREQEFEYYFDTNVKRDPYRVVVSEIMLQQTQVDRVLEKYLTWMKKWPRIEDLAKTTLSEVIIEWKGLGYNRRARFLWLLAKEIVEKRKGEWPVIEVELMKLPGIGRYTARAVMSFSFGGEVGVIDTNVKRIFQRLRFEKLKAEQHEKVFFELADQILPNGLADPWNQALMDFGALVCSAKNPRCEKCPLEGMCEANIHAKRNGFDNFAHCLKSEVSIGEKKVKRQSVKFEESDRFLRGRVVDELRNNSINTQELKILLNTKFTQFNHERISVILSQLEREQLIIIENQRVSLA